MADKPKQVEIVAFCLMPNHYHLLLKQLTPGGISNFIRLVGNSYTRYLNTAEQRVGPIFQGRFKSILVESDAYLLHLSRYIHLNPLATGIVTKQDILSYRYSSLLGFVKEADSSLVSVHPKIVTDQFSSPRDYYQFCLDTDDYFDTLFTIKEFAIDVDD
jgi:putative transposase